MNEFRLTDHKAAELLRLLALYVADCRDEGDAPAATLDIKLAELVADLEMSSGPGLEIPSILRGEG